MSQPHIAWNISTQELENGNPLELCTPPDYDILPQTTPKYSSFTLNNSSSMREKEYNPLDFLTPPAQNNLLCPSLKTYPIVPRTFYNQQELYSTPDNDLEGDSEESTIPNPHSICTTQSTEEEYKNSENEDVCGSFYSDDGVSQYFRELDEAKGLSDTNLLPGIYLRSDSVASIQDMFPTPETPSSEEAELVGNII